MEANAGLEVVEKEHFISFRGGTVRDVTVAHIAQWYGKPVHSLKVTDVLEFLEAVLSPIKRESWTVHSLGVAGALADPIASTLYSWSVQQYATSFGNLTFHVKIESSPKRHRSDVEHDATQPNLGEQALETVAKLARESDNCQRKLEDSRRQQQQLQRKLEDSRRQQQQLQRQLYNEQKLVASLLSDFRRSDPSERLRVIACLEAECDDLQKQLDELQGSFPVCMLSQESITVGKEGEGVIAFPDGTMLSKQAYNEWCKAQGRYADAGTLWPTAGSKHGLKTANGALIYPTTPLFGNALYPVVSGWQQLPTNKPVEALIAAVQTQMQIVQSRLSTKNQELEALRASVAPSGAAGEVSGVAMKDDGGESLLQAAIKILREHTQFPLGITDVLDPTAPSAIILVTLQFEGSPRTIVVVFARPRRHASKQTQALFTPIARQASVALLTVPYKVDSATTTRPHDPDYCCNLGWGTERMELILLTGGNVLIVPQHSGFAQRPQIPSQDRWDRTPWKVEVLRVTAMVGGMGTHADCAECVLTDSEGKNPHRQCCNGAPTNYEYTPPSGDTQITAIPID